MGDRTYFGPRRTQVNGHTFHWDKYGQGMLWSPMTGTGLSRDPISRDRRLQLSRGIASYGGPPATSPFGPFGKEDAAQALFRSRMPLQDLADLYHSGLNLGVEEPVSAIPGKGQFYYNMEGDPSIDIHHEYAFPHIIGHEIGHAVHANRHPQTFEGSEQESEEAYSGYVPITTSHYANPVKEGIADAYSARYFPRALPWQTKSRYRQLFSGMGLATYNATRRHVRETGDIPVGTNADVGAAVRKKYTREKSVNNDQQLPGIEW